MEKSIEEKIEEVREEFEKKLVNSIVLSIASGSDYNTDTMWKYIEHKLREVSKSERLYTLDLIADGEGWEDSRDYYAGRLGLELKYYKHIKNQ